ncbi:Porin, Gram-negative type [Cupriavidus taiwanensis]|uniref:porin n=1 Tax=Cupriavidus taiwanensis TaxID=164546 RepID=UPI000E17C9E6|nr:porin [Cupriavidus taiwanensis]SOZ18796.1 Porin, Gram-negative type [Cupriavidus taiwanensis]SOZ32081.1 Porin, Gram-negative type [Cupriavidus taiwanensis]SOZ47708.1 Porin, Gram-negative type [Cupriavidus taiwanensis]
MDKRLAGIAVAGFFPLAASATSVTIYGVADSFVGYFRNSEKSVTGLNSGGLAGSRWGMRGTEDLSADLKAVFVLEGGYNMDTGTNAQGGRLFGRRATVGMRSNTYGEIALGRQPTPGYDFAAIFDPVLMAPGSVAASLTGESSNPWMFNPLNDPARSDNAVRYNSPSFGGVTVSAAHVFSENAGTPVNRNYDIVTFLYTANKLSAGYGFARATGTTNQTPDTSRQLEHAFAASYETPWATLYANYQLRYRLGAAHDSAWQVGTTIPVGAAGNLKLAYGMRDTGVTNGLPDNTPTADVAAWAIGYTHNISKRTTLYAFFKRLENRGSSRQTIYPPGGLAAPAQLHEKVSALGAGIYHRF